MQNSREKQPWEMTKSEVSRLTNKELIEAYAKAYRYVLPDAREILDAELKKRESGMTVDEILSSPHIHPAQVTFEIYKQWYDKYHPGLVDYYGRGAKIEHNEFINKQAIADCVPVPRDVLDKYNNRPG